MPALLTTMSSGPRSFRTASPIKPAICATSAVLAWTANAVPPACSISLTTAAALSGLAL
jgi:hypothetical protein